MERPLQGQVAIVTGAARGIGRATAATLSASGATVAMFDIDEPALTVAVEELQTSGSAASALVVDVSDPGRVDEAVQEVARAHGRLDILINNAGVFPHTPFEDLTFGEWRRVLSTNLDSVFLMTHAVYPVMVTQERGAIVNISTAAFHIGYPGLTPYLASKGGIIGFTRSLAAEAGHHGITVNAITPGMIETEGALDEDPDGALFAEIRAGQAVDRRGLPDDIAAAIEFLVGPKASFITGQTINIDGGHRFH